MIVCPRCGGEAEASLNCRACHGAGHLTWDEFARVMDADDGGPVRHYARPSAHHDACVAFMLMVRMQSGRHPCLRWLHHIGNERRDVKEARTCKAEGTLPGVPDYCLPWPAGGAHGLYLEMKTPGDSLRHEQRAFLEAVAAAGYRAAVAYGAAQAWQAVEEYLTGVEQTPGEIVVYR